MDQSHREKKLPGPDDTFSPVFSSMQNVSEDSGQRNFLDGPSPYRTRPDNTSSDEALKQIKTANTVSISPGTSSTLRSTVERKRKRTDADDRAF